MHIRRVRTDLKLGADDQLGPKTLIVGHNASGKSTVVSGIELALTSRVSDIAGRTDVAREADVMSLAPAGAKSIIAEVFFQAEEPGGNAAASYAVEGTTASAKKAHVVRPAFIPDDVLTIRTMKEALLGSAVTARKWLIQKMGLASQLSDIEALIPIELHKDWRALVATQPSTMPAIDALVKVLELAGQRQREATAAANAQREVISAASAGRGAPPTEAEIQTAQDDLAHRKSDLKRVTEAWAARTARESVTQEIRNEWLAAAYQKLASIERAAEVAASHRDALKAKLANLPAPISLPEGTDAAIETMRASIKFGSCQCCGSKPPTAAELAEVEALVKQTAADRGARAQFAADIRLAEANVEKLLTDYDMQQSTIDDMMVAPEEEDDTAGMTETDDWTVTPEMAQSDVDAAQTDLDDLKAARDAQATVQRAQGIAVTQDKASQSYSQLKEACASALAALMTRAIESFVAKVQAFLPSTDVFGLRLRDGEREVMQYGLVRGGMIHSALSGAEWARVTMAMASACVPAGQYACLIPEERAFDPRTLRSVMEAMSNSPHQVILTSPVEPESIPAGWTVVRKSRAEPQTRKTLSVEEAQRMILGVEAGEPGVPSAPKKRTRGPRPVVDPEALVRANKVLE